MDRTRILKVWQKLASRAGKKCTLAARKTMPDIVKVIKELADLEEKE
jgi:hypothetical protein